jgi:hypothetical protein
MGMDVIGKGIDGEKTYFRANVWSWRPIHSLVARLNKEKDFGFDLKYWGSNDGKGLQTNDDCRKLAQAIEEVLETAPDPVPLQLSEGDAKKVFAGTTITNDSYSTSHAHLKEFITFLRKSESFEIW